MSKMTIKDLCYSYGKREVLKHISFEAKGGEYVYILGPNGVGKSTLFRCILGHLKAESGQIIIDDRKISEYRPNELAGKVAYIPQICHSSFNYSILQLVMMGRTAHLSPFSSPGKEDHEIAYRVLKKLELGDKAQQGICEVSGGERQLAMIARALVQEAEILIMDEPTSNLDYGNQVRIQQQMKKLAAEGMLIIQSSHNPQHARLFGDKVVALQDGRVVDCGKAEEVITTELLYELYGIQVQVQGNSLIPLLG